MKKAIVLCMLFLVATMLFASSATARIAGSTRLVPEDSSNRARGSMFYGIGSYVLGANRLPAYTDYTVVVYDDMEDEVFCFGEGTTNRRGCLSMRHSWLLKGDKVAVVLSEDVDCESNSMTAINSDEYLYGKVKIWGPRTVVDRQAYRR
jgi:hypothetical protein